MKRYFSLDECGPEVLNADLLGGKGLGLVKMKAAGINVPPAYIITTETCKEYMKDSAGVMKALRQTIIPTMFIGFEKEFGYFPLLAVRSGAKFSMPGMMDTILNVGLCDDTLNEWRDRVGLHCAQDSHKRLQEMFKDVVGTHLPFTPQEQLAQAIEAVFKSWNNERAKTYRQLNGIDDDLGTAVIVQAMVFGNLNDKSCTGVLFTRDPSTGEDKARGEWLVNAQGEDIVAGTRTPEALDKIGVWNPIVAVDLQMVAQDLEISYRDMVDIEFTVQDGKLYILQVRAGKRTAQAAIKIAVDMYSANMITAAEVAQRVTYKQLLIASRPVIDAKWKEVNPAHAKGIPASNGVAVGEAVFSSEAALKCKKPCILIAQETTPDDIAGMNAAIGILTATGGATSHAAVVARGMDKVCVVGCQELVRGIVGDVWHLNKNVICEGNMVAIDGETGEIWVNQIPIVIDGAAKPEVKMFRDIVKGLYDTFEVITSAKDVAGKSKIVVQTAALRSPDKILECMNAFAGEVMVLDTRSKVELIEKEDQVFVDHFGEDCFDDVDTVGHYKAVIAALKAFEGDRSKVWVLGGGVSMNDVVAAGYKAIPTITTLSQLVEVEGLCVPDFDKLIKSAGSAKVVKKLVDVRRMAGEHIQSFNIFNVKCEPEVFEKGSAVAVVDKVLFASILG